MKLKEAIGRKLYDLLEKSYDAEKGLKSASERVKNERLKNFFRQKWEERKLFITELRKEIKGLVDFEAYSSNVKINFNRSWMNLRTAFSKNTEQAILEECINGEKEALKDYKEITKERELPTGLSKKLNRQQQNLQASINNQKMYEQMFD